MDVNLVRPRKGLILALCILFTGQLNANQLQTAAGIQHTVPKLVQQTGAGQASVTSQDITGYGQSQDANSDQAKALQPNTLNFYQNPFFYGSGYYDNESGLQYMGARYYSAKLAIFMAQDGYNLLNRYRYANANPIMNIDPDGHLALGFLPDTWKGAIGMLIGIGVGGVVAGIAGLYATMLDTAAKVAIGGVVVGGISGGAGNAAQYAFTHKAFDWQQLATSVVSGALIGFMSGGVTSRFRPGEDWITVSTDISHEDITIGDDSLTLDQKTLERGEVGASENNEAAFLETEGGKFHKAKQSINRAENEAEYEKTIGKFDGADKKYAQEVHDKYGGYLQDVTKVRVSQGESFITNGGRVTTEKYRLLEFEFEKDSENTRTDSTNTSSSGSASASASASTEITDKPIEI